MAVSKLIFERRTTIDRSGYISFFREDGFNVFLIRDFVSLNELVTKSRLRYFENNPIIDSTTLFSALEMRKVGEQKEYVEKLKQMNVESEEFINILDKLSPNIISQFIEDAVLDYHKVGYEWDKVGSITKIIWGKYGNYIFIFKEPLGLESAIKTEKGPRGRGRPAKETTLKSRLEDKALKMLLFSGNELIWGSTYVFVHNYLEKHGRLDPSSTIEKSRLRLFNPRYSENWRDLEAEYEVPIYKAMITERQQRMAQPTNGKDLYATKSKDKSFKIIDNSIDPTTHKKRAPKGKVCTFFNEFEIFNYAYTMGIRPTYSGHVPSYEEMKNMLKLRLESRSVEIDSFDYDKTLAFYLFSDKNVYNKTILCQLLEQKFIQAELMFYRD